MLSSVYACIGNYDAFYMAVGGRGSLLVSRYKGASLWDQRVVQFGLNTTYARSLAFSHVGTCWFSGFLALVLAIGDTISFDVKALVGTSQFIDWMCTIAV